MYTLGSSFACICNFQNQYLIRNEHRVQRRDLPRFDGSSWSPLVDNFPTTERKDFRRKQFLIRYISPGASKAYHSKRLRLDMWSPWCLARPMVERLGVHRHAGAYCYAS